MSNDGLAIRVYSYQFDFDTLQIEIPLACGLLLTKGNCGGSVQGMCPYHWLNRHQLLLTGVAWS